MNTEEQELTREPVENRMESRQEMKREVIEFVKMIVWFLLLFFGLRCWVIEGYEVQGPSMTPTLRDQERILVWKLPHLLSRTRLFGGFDSIGPGDIVVFESPGDSDKRFVKRVVAEGPMKQRGKTVEAGLHPDYAAEEVPVTVRFEEGLVYVNNRRLPERYIHPEQRRTTESHEPVALHAGQYYVLGDNRNVSKDSRSFGPIDDGRLVGKAVLRFWPLHRFGLVR